jgi:hypothetical protein
MNTLYEQLLLFPDRAENLGQFETYDVDLDHWKSLSTVFRQTFRNVYERGASAILLVHGRQGTGKTLFSRRLTQDFEAASKGAGEPDRKNLWHTLVGEDPPTKATILEATRSSALRRIEPHSGWLEKQRIFAKENAQQTRVRIFVIDDAHKDVFMREWASLSQAEYLGFKERKNESVVLSSVAEKLVEDCRGDFLKSIFLLLSNDAARMTELKEHIDKSHAGLATILELPLPDAKTKEQIIRKNTNRLNRMSYWYCVDAAGKEERMATYEVLNDEAKGFTDCFLSVDQALRSDARRAGRPANRNLITLVTLGTPPSAAKVFIGDEELTAEEHHCANHLGIWWMREQWASTLYEGDEPGLSRRARMLESEFALRWVALDMKSTFLLCQAPSPGDVGERLLALIRFVPSIAKPEEVKKHGDLAAQIDTAIDGITAADLPEFERQFSPLGQRRSTLYEPAIVRRLGTYSHGFRVFPAVKPDCIVSEYVPCALTSAKDNKADAIKDAIKRECHAIEFTSHLQDEMAGLKKYLLQKVERYALLLESV